MSKRLKRRYSSQEENNGTKSEESHCVKSPNQSFNEDSEDSESEQSP